MKRFFAIIFALLLLTACGKEEPTPVTEPVEAPVEEVQEQAPPVEEVPIVVEPAEETEVSGETSVTYTSTALEGLVEDTVGYSFEIPTFEVDGADAICTYYEELAAHLEGYTKDKVYGEAVSRGCVASVYGSVVSATVEDEVLTVQYAFEADYSDTDEAEENIRTDRFQMQTGERLAD